MLGRRYEALMRIDYQYAAVLEFDDVAGYLAAFARDSPRVAHDHHAPLRSRAPDR